MSQKQISVTFEGIDSWEDSREKVDDTLAELTGTNEYPATRSLPPIIFGIEYGSYKTIFAMYLMDELALILRRNLGLVKKVLGD
ncbi:hypothetical protein BDV36DRAFT_292636 [Aspergillus pseudocaelatus]|uniref:Uncharacterized protein n=1 Tax=Aspergillus pseudocaelatus TaxID=1825620 RepID=A0ABQ6WV19_9EURO|nr:hypothetical protein BDV36DRAFT_292636 [Aspergillus pseudocaelatus]